MSYNPFDKNIHETLEINDLKKLITNSVAEGYYVEFKEEFPKNEKIGHSIASFANTYGGWYIIGIKADKVNNCAVNICGFDFIKTHDPIAKVREIVKSHIDPIPLFFPKVIKISNDKAVLVVFIPENQETPFICKDGRIYRRESDSSSPISESNRYAVDRLIENGLKTNDRFLNFCKDNRTFAEFESDICWLNIYLYPYPEGSVESTKTITNESLENIVKMSKEFTEEIKVNTNIPFNTYRITRFC